jgi:hypothetical protein
MLQLKSCVTPCISTLGEHHGAEVELGVGVSLIGCLSPPPHSFPEVLLHALTFKVHDAEVALGECLPLIGCLASITTARPRRSPASRRGLG